MVGNTAVETAVGHTTVVMKESVKEGATAIGGHILGPDNLEGRLGSP